MICYGFMVNILPYLLPLKNVRGQKPYGEKILLILFSLIRREVVILFLSC